MTTSIQSVLTALFTLTAQIVLALPEDLDKTVFSGPEITPCPAALCAAANGDVYVAVDLNGSLARDPGKGRIIKLRDTDNDGIADEHTIFAEIDNVRGLISFGYKLYVLHTVIPKDTGITTGMHLSLLQDTDHNGIADEGRKTLISNVSTLKHNQERGADHTTNGIQMGIDGWIYIAVGDYGFVDAEGTDGRKLTNLGGGILRVRPDGTEMEMYTQGMRNIYDVAIDPFMNIFTRGNTNDGGGWNVRFTHHIQSGHYGYPMLFKSFTDEILPALADVGGGSGVGALFFQEPEWPTKYNNVSWMADWGRSKLIIHRITPDGASFTQQHEDFISTSQISDVDVDGSGRVYLSAWDGAGFKGNINKGFVERVVPKSGWSYQPFPELKNLNSPALLELLTQKDSAKARLTASQELLERNDPQSIPALLRLAKNEEISLEGRVAALFTYAQLGKEEAIKDLVSLTEDNHLAEFALRALADRKPLAEQIPLHPFLSAMHSSNPRIRTTATVGLGRLGKDSAIDKLVEAAVLPQSDPNQKTVPYYSSPIISGHQSYTFDVTASSFKQINLISSSLGDIEGDHIVWENPKIIQSDGVIIQSTKDLNIRKINAQQGKHKTHLNKDCLNNPLTDSKGNPIADGIGTHADSVLTLPIPNKSLIETFQVTARFSEGSKGKGSAQFFISPQPELAPEEGPHASPNEAIIQPHLAINALVQLHAVEQCLAAIDGPSQDGVLQALRRMHQPKVVDGLIAKYKSSNDAKLKQKIFTALARLYTKEAPYDGSWWWKTRPDTRGPYYVPVQWEQSPKIEEFLISEYQKANTELRFELKSIAAKQRTHIEAIDGLKTVSEGASLKGEVGRTSIEDIMLSLDQKKGKIKNGRKIINRIGCAGCHNTSAKQPVKAPDLTLLQGQSKHTIAESILRPGAAIAPSWVTLVMKNDSNVMGTLVTQDATHTVIHNIAGIPTTVKTSEIKETQPGPPLMTMHLVDDLSIQEFADLIAYMQAISKPK